ncbi:hypothetical protein Clacol_006286 [Clathrus columnatus]|uniref:NAD(P)-binding domain-containing protein n=1 Tax=Clathrus columnatus TaxID=1419009 RepID=A0AAV5ACH5_9AGAM|nr:hypothetical protein Clacol_006286 [Clathrus columnatus]
MPMNILALGASRNIGYFACKSLLNEGHSVTFVLRKPSVFESDTEIQSFIKNGKAKIIPGDATVRADIQKAIDSTTETGLDVILFSVGGAPSVSLTKGVFIDPPNLCSSSLLNVLACYPDVLPQPKLIVVSANGLTKAGYGALPLYLKPVFTVGLKKPYADKRVMETVIFRAANWTWPEETPKDMRTFLGADWEKELREPGFLKEIVIIRPSLLVDGDDKVPAEGKYQTTTEELKKPFSITRKEVAHFITEKLLKQWEDWNGKIVKITSS